MGELTRASPPPRGPGAEGAYAGTVAPLEHLYPVVGRIRNKELVAARREARRTWVRVRVRVRIRARARARVRVRVRARVRVRDRDRVRVRVRVRDNTWQ